MDEVAFHREPPANIPTMVTAFSGWIDAGEAATDAMRFLVRQLAAEPLATIDLENSVDFPIGGFSPPEGRLARGFKPPAFSRFLFQSAVKSAESF